MRRSQRFGDPLVGVLVVEDVVVEIRAELGRVERDSGEVCQRFGRQLRLIGELPRRRLRDAGGQEKNRGQCPEAGREQSVH